MEIPWKPPLFWTPRVLCLLFAVFLSLFALDVFNEGYGFWKTILALFMHLVPTWIVLAVLAISWRWEWAGALLFACLGTWYLISTWGRMHWSTYVVRYPIAEARGFPALTFPRGEDSESRASYEAALHAALARPLLIELILERLTACPGPPKGRLCFNRCSRGSVFSRWLDPTGDGPVCNQRFFISTSGGGRSSPCLKAGASRPKIG